MTSFDLLRSLDGLEALEKMRRGEIPSAPVTNWMGFTIERAERGFVVWAMRPREELYNLIGSVHGGIITTFMDTALGTAVQSLLPPGQVATTMDLHTRFHRPVTTAVPVIYAEARAVHHGRRTATSEAKIVDGDGKIFATGTSTLLILHEAPPRGA